MNIAVNTVPPAQRAPVDFQPVRSRLVLWLKAWVARLCRPRRTSAAITDPHLATNKWCDQTERKLHRAIDREWDARHPW